MSIFEHNYKVAKIKNNNLIQVWLHINIDQAYAICSLTENENKIPSPINEWHLMLKTVVVNHFSKEINDKKLKVSYQDLTGIEYWIYRE